MNVVNPSEADEADDIHFLERWIGGFVFCSKSEIISDYVVKCVDV